jgi:hypothetical protein
MASDFSVATSEWFTLCLFCPTASCSTNIDGSKASWRLPRTSEKVTKLVRTNSNRTYERYLKTKKTVWQFDRLSCQFNKLTWKPIWLTGWENRLGFTGWETNWTYRFGNQLDLQVWKPIRL